MLTRTEIETVKNLCSEALSHIEEGSLGYARASLTTLATYAKSRCGDVWVNASTAHSCLEQDNLGGARNRISMTLDAAFYHAR